MHETRVNLKHLLEDIRDSYPLSLEEVIINELIANALDSGASQISFFITEAGNIGSTPSIAEGSGTGNEPIQRLFTIADNGKGMNRKELAEYHNIAASTKTRGRGIGFAGVGAKLSLLISNAVITESRGPRRSQSATTWHLASTTRAPWKFIPFSGKFLPTQGTTVTMALAHGDSPLVSADFVRQTIISHYFPVFVPEFREAIFKFIYKKGVDFFINGQKVDISEKVITQQAKLFRVYLGGRRAKQPAGFGYITLHETDEPFGRFGLAISTYGKIIKYGWEWIGVTPKINTNIYGIVEIPGIAQILTINKMDFLKDSASLKKYYKFRKAIQEAVLPILEALGQQQEPKEKSQALKPLAADMDRTIKNMMPDFPELAPLLGVKKVSGKNASRMFEDNPLVGVVETMDKEPISQETITKIPASAESPVGRQETNNPKNPKSAKKKSKKGPAIYIGFETGEENGLLSHMVESRILVNTMHPSYIRALEAGYADYHVVFCVAWTLSQFLDEKHSTHQFINHFLASWGETGNNKIQKILA